MNTKVVTTCKPKEIKSAQATTAIRASARLTHRSVSRLGGSLGDVDVSRRDSSDDERSSHGDGSPVERNPSSHSIEGEDGDEDGDWSVKRQSSKSVSSLRCMSPRRTQYLHM